MIRIDPTTRTARVVTRARVDKLQMLTINVVTIFPDFFAAPLGLSIPSRARGGRVASSIASSICATTRTTGTARSTTIRMAAAPGMVMKPEPFFEAVEAIGAKRADRADVRARPTLLAGRRRAFRRGTELTLLCGHYKDVDQRVADHLATEEISLGDFVLSGGEPAALAIIDATVRLLPGAMSDLDSARTDSFFERGLSAPSYTRPPEFRGIRCRRCSCPATTSKIAEWRDEGERLTREREDSD